MHSIVNPFRKPSSRRRGTIIVLSALVFVIVFGFVAFVVDVGQIALVKSQLQTAADGAALAAVQELSDPLVSEASGLELLLALAKSRQAAMDVASANPNGELSGTSLGPLDVLIGNYALNQQTGQWEFQLGGSPFNAAKVFARRTGAQGTALRLSFAPAIGHQNANVNESAIAAIMVATGISSPGCIPSPILPFALDLDSAIPGSLEFGGKRGILKIVFVNEDLLVG